MKNFILNLLNKDEKLLKHSALVMSATMIGMVIGYFFQVFVGRMLGPADYGIFGSLISIMYIISVFGGTINTSIAKFSSKFKARKEYGKIKTLLVIYSSKLFMSGCLIFMIILFSSSWIAGILNIPTTLPIIILGLTFPLSFLQAVVGGLMRGLQMFKKYSIVSITGPVAKFIIGVGLVALGFGVAGAIAGLVFSGLIACLVSFIFFRFLLKEKMVKVPKTDILKYSLPVFIVILCITIMTNIDVILVKYFFSSESAGFYVAASTLTKVIFFVSGTLTTVMFPKVSDMHEKKADTKKILRNALFYIFTFSALVIISLWISPYFITTMVFGHAFEQTSAIILPFAVAMTFASLSCVIVNYDLAMKKMRIIYPLIIATGLEIFMIITVHSLLLEVIKILIGVNALLFFMLLILNKDELIGNGTLCNNTGI
ncbi:oligosaccharide flippase family protein [bacterium]|nr:oligosaccharide flippase family protein [bacterium]